MNHDGQRSEVVLALSRPRLRHHFEAFAGLLPFRMVHLYDWDPKAIETHKPVVLLTLTDAWFEADRCIRRARELGIPSLLVMDGIVEWRHQWEDPAMGPLNGVGYYQPVTTDKIACIGRQTVRLLESWGNIGKCELVGCPRLDPFLIDPMPEPKAGGPRRLLVMTASTPAFTSEQSVKVERSLQDLKAALLGDRTWEVLWRVKRDLKETLGLPDSSRSLDGAPLRDALSWSHAVITTPSTVQLEAMLARRPTALLDYSNTPHYVSAAWTITARNHIEQVLLDLLDPPHHRMLHQDFVLHDCLECYTPAAPRMATLICEMTRLRLDAQREGSPMAFPARILAHESFPFTEPSAFADLARLYPANKTLSSADLVKLQRRVVFQRQQIAALKSAAGLARLVRWAKSRVAPHKE